MHGLAIVCHRIWHSFGYKMNGMLAWFITFNFVNIAWVFFRANEWKDAVKVLNGMISIPVMILLEFIQDVFMQNIEQLNSRYMELLIHSSEVSSVEVKLSSIVAIAFIIVTLIYTLSGRNSNELLKQFTPNTLPFVGIVMMLFYAFVASVYWDYDVEFLYFNF